MTEQSDSESSANSTCSCGRSESSAHSTCSCGCRHLDHDLELTPGSVLDAVPTGPGIVGWSGPECFQFSVWNQREYVRAYINSMNILQDEEEAIRRGLFPHPRIPMELYPDGNYDPDWDQDQMNDAVRHVRCYNYDELWDGQEEPVPLILVTMFGDNCGNLVHVASKQQFFHAGLQLFTRYAWRPYRNTFKTLVKRVIQRNQWQRECAVVRETLTPVLLRDLHGVICSYLPAHVAPLTLDLRGKALACQVRDESESESDSDVSGCNCGPGCATWRAEFAANV